MKKTLTVHRNATSLFYFSYGKPSDGFAWVAFDTEDAGYGNFSRPTYGPDKAPQVPGPAKYCKQTAIKGGGMKVVCSFPAW
jgi:hypothetical protein